jgi:hypothetical protein
MSATSAWDDSCCCEKCYNSHGDCADKGNCECHQKPRTSASTTSNPIGTGVEKATAGFGQQRRYRSDDRDLHDHDKELVVSMGGNGDWYVMIVDTGRKLGPSVRITTSGAPHGQDMAAPAVANLYRALGGEAPTLLIGRDAPDVMGVFEVQRLHEMAAQPALAAEVASLRSQIANLSADVRIAQGNASNATMQNAKLHGRVAELEAELEKERGLVQAVAADAERWRRDAVEDQPSHEILAAVRHELGLKDGQSTFGAIKALAELAASRQKTIDNIRKWVAIPDGLAADNSAPPG